MRGIGRFIFWDYGRGSWQYDVMVGLILAFIFLMPREIFNDQPKAANVVILRGGFWIDPQLLAGVPDQQLVTKAAALVNQRYKTRPVITAVEPIPDDSGEIKGYMAFTNP
ncbi:MAG TPA: hypothetical protein VMG40_06390 [Bryobacteraceae bacterium]|nr:hypothetical protein [Bryobacteraceae bacterium]